MTRLSAFNTKCAYMLACALTLAASGVQAGGAAVVATEPAVSSPVAKSFWSGVWGGVSLGQGTATYGLGLGFDTIENPETLFGLKLPALGATGGLAAIELGYGRDFGNGWVAGLQLDYTAASIHNDSGFNFAAGTIGGGNPPIAVATTLQAKNMVSGLGRLGYLTSENTMIYGLFGVTHANFDAGISGSAGDSFGGTSEGLALTAATIGAGIETRIGERTSLKLEYRMTDFGDYSLVNQQVGDNLTMNAGISTKSQSIRATFAVHF